MGEAEFGRLGPLQELGSRQPRMVQGFLLTLGYIRLSCVIPVFKQDLPTVIDWRPLSKNKMQLRSSVRL